jgi:tetratricopeptide (TPR) repeat protein
MQYIEGRSLAQLIAELRRLEGLDAAEPAAGNLADISTSKLADSLVSGRLARGAGGRADRDLNRSPGGRRDEPEPATPTPSQEPGIPTPRPAGDRPSGSSTRSSAYIRTVAQFGVQVAEALDHSHTRGILHRDIKPANLLLDDQGALWVTDFGLAQIQGNPGLTLTGDILGTLRYMSPEQALGKRVVIDGRTDLYSLGVTLYELLTLRPAVDGKDRQEILRKIAEEEPAPPRKLNPAVPRDLETILLKAMAKEPGGRYATAKDLAEDLERFQEDRPICANRPSLTQWLWKWGRRHRALVWSAAVSLVLLLATVVTALAVGLRAVQSEQKRTAAALAAESRRRQQARQALDAMSSHIVDQWLSSQPVLLPEHKGFLEQALAWYEEFAAETEQDEAARVGVAGAYFRVGAIRHLLGQAAEAEAAYRSSLAIDELLVRDFPEVTAHALDMAGTSCSLGNLELHRGQPVAAQAWYDSAIQVLEPLTRAQPDLVRVRSVLAASYHSLGLSFGAQDRAADADAAYRKALDLRERVARDFPDKAEYATDLGESYSSLGILERERRRPDSALTWYAKAIRTLEPVVRRHPGALQARALLASTYDRRGNSLRDLGRLADAEAALREAMSILKRLVGDFPNRLSFRQKLALAECNLGDFLTPIGRFEEAEAAYRRAQAILESLARDSPGMSDTDLFLGYAYCGIGMVAAARGHLGEGLPWMDKAILVLGPVVRQQPRLANARRLLFMAHFNRAAALVESGRPAEALQSYDHALALDVVPFRSLIRLARASTLARLGQHAKATAESDELTKAREVGMRDLYTAACVYSLSSAAARYEPALRERYAARAMELLLRAVQTGYRDAAHMKEDADLDPIRNRSDFQGLITDLAFPTDPFAR